MKDEGYGEEYKYPHNYNKSFIKQNYFPDVFNKPLVFYFPKNEGREKNIKERLEKIWEERYK